MVAAAIRVGLVAVVVMVVMPPLQAPVQAPMQAQGEMAAGVRQADMAAPVDRPLRMETLRRRSVVQAVPEKREVREAAPRRLALAARQPLERRGPALPQQELLTVPWVAAAPAALRVQVVQAVTVVLAVMVATLAQKAWAASVVSVV